MIYDQFGRPAPPSKPRVLGFVPPPALTREEDSEPMTDAVSSISIGPIDEVYEL